MKTTLILIFLLCIGQVQAQQDSVKLANGYFFGVGIAAGKGSQEGLYVQAHGEVQHLTSYLALKLSGFAKLNIMGPSYESSISELGLVFGKNYRVTERQRVQFGAGLAVVTAVSKGEQLPCKSCSFLERTRYQMIAKYPIGVPMEIKYNYYINRTGAISFSLNTNINEAQSYFGAAIGFIAIRKRP